MTREQQKLRIVRIRRAIIAGSATSALAVAGYLGFSAPGAVATTTTGTGTTSDSGTTTSDSFTTQFGDNSTQLSSGSGTAHATTSGS